MREAAECEKAGLNGSFARLSIPLPQAPPGILVGLRILLYNLQTRIIGISEIRTVFASEWERMFMIIEGTVKLFCNFLEWVESNEYHWILSDIEYSRSISRDTNKMIDI